MVAFNFKESVSVSVSFSDIASMTDQDGARLGKHREHYRISTELQDGNGRRSDKEVGRNIRKVFKTFNLRSIFAGPFVQQGWVTHWPLCVRHFLGPVFPEG